MSSPPEDQRLAQADKLEVTLYSRPGCHLCDEARAVIAPLLQEFSAYLREINIDEDAALAARFACDIPVLFIGARKVAKHRVDLEQFRRQLQAAQQNR
jgi:glutaredoxin